VLLDTLWILDTLLLLVAAEPDTLEVVLGDFEALIKQRVVVQL
jgi:hypothetical protein